MDLVDLTDDTVAVVLTPAPVGTVLPIDLTNDPARIDLTVEPIDLTVAPIDLTNDPAPIDVTVASIDVTVASIDVTVAPVDLTNDPAAVDWTNDPAAVDLTVAPIDADKKWILRQFFEHLEGKTLKGATAVHDGQEGHAVERAFGLTPNARNEPDIRGYELKKCSVKITFFDLAGVYPFSKNPEAWLNYAGESVTALQEELAADAPLKTRTRTIRTNFIRKFGTFKDKPDGRVRASWSGTCFPKVGAYNAFGQTLEVDPEGTIVAFYNAALDQRVVQGLDHPIPIALWPRAVLEKALQNKFGQKGFVLCKQDAHGVYRSICFGPPITFELFLDQFRKGIVHIDSGMKEGNARCYSHFRAPQHFWLHLVQEEWTRAKFKDL